MSDIQYAVQKYQEIKRLLSSHSFAISSFKEINYGLQFSIEKPNWSGLIRIYQNKRGNVKVDLSQIEHSEVAAVVSSVLDLVGHTFSTPVRVSDDCAKGSPPEADTASQTAQLPMLGSDESGKGDYFGPLVVSCVYADKKIAKSLLDVGARDSKALSDTQITQIAKRVRGICVDRFSVVEIMPEKYNDMYSRFRREKKTLNDMLAWAHAKAIETMLERVDCRTAVIDKFCDESQLLSKLQSRGQQLKVIQVPRAESYVAVAAASIIARDRFVSRLKELGDQYDVQLPKGASGKVVSVAQILAEKNGKGAMRKIAKEHFKTTQAVFSV